MIWRIGLSRWGFSTPSFSWLLLAITLFMLGDAKGAPETANTSANHRAASQPQPAVADKKDWVWVHQRHWNTHWQREYNRWVSNLKISLFKNKNSRYAGLGVIDCADFIYATYIIFAYENRLPFKIHFACPGGTCEQKYLSNTSSRFARQHRQGLPRVKALIRYVARNYGTQHLAKDSYPISIAREQLNTPFGFGPGVINLHPGGHSLLITGVDPFGNVSAVYATTGAKAELFVEQSANLLKPYDDESYLDGFRRLRWPQYLNKSLKHIPWIKNGAFKTQYALAKRIDEVTFTELLKHRFAVQQLPPGAELKYVFEDICHDLKDSRTTYVHNALQYLASKRAQNPRYCMTPTEYDKFSSPSRDARINAKFFRLLRLLERTDPASINADAQPYYEATRYLFGYAEDTHEGASAFVNQLYDADKEALIQGLCSFKIDKHYILNIKDYYWSFTQGKISANPNAPLELRWGLYDADDARVKAFEKLGCPEY